MHQSRDRKAINIDGNAPRYAHSVVLVSKLCLSKVVIQLPRNIEEHEIAHVTPYFVFFHFAINLVKREPSKLAIFILWPTVVEKH